MQTLKNLNQDQKSLVEMKGLVEIYEEIAAGHMQKIRADIVTSREFYDGLAKLSEEVGADFTNLRVVSNKPTVVVFISANAGMFGDIVNKIFFQFVEFVRGNPYDVLVVGKWGEEMMREFAPDIVHKYVELADDKVDLEVLSHLMYDLFAYGKIIVYYGKFDSVVNQTPTSATISGQMLPANRPKKVENKSLRFLYEPTLERISEVFGNEIYASVFEQTLRESQLAKYASRLMHLDSALDRIDDTITDVVGAKRRVRKRLNDKKQLAIAIGFRARQIQGGAR